MIISAKTNERLVGGANDGMESMGEVVNLNRVRKARAKALTEKTAANNRVKHGTPKALRKLSEAERKKQQGELDAKRLDEGEE